MANNELMFGNTTIRNPIRFPDGLRLLQNSKFNGNLCGTENELGFAKLLNTNGIVNMTTDDASLGRKWRSALSKMGFITNMSSRKNKDSQREQSILVKQVKERHPDINLSGFDSEITPQGRRLSQAEDIYDMQDAFLRSMLCIQVEINNVMCKPFVFIIQVLDQLVKKGESKGINRLELMIVLTSLDHSQAIEIAEKIIKFRQDRKIIIGKNLKTKFDDKFIEPFAKQRNIKIETLKTYGDPNYKYILATGLFSRQGDRLVFNEDKQILIDEILATEPKFTTDKIDYFYNFWNGYPLPNDNEYTLIQEIKMFSNKIGVTIDNLRDKTIPDLKKVLYELEKKEDAINERNFASIQSTPENLNEVIRYLRVLNKDLKSGVEFDNAKDDLPTYFEWAVWRSFLAIDGLVNPVGETRGFRVDQDFYPVGHAPGGRPDIVLEFSKYTLVVEVTLTSTSRQESAEAEPVRRHVAGIQEENQSNKPVYGLFLAPSIDNNAAEMFRTGMWYKGDDPKFINIVPMSLGQFIEIMESFKNIHFENNQFERLIEKCLIPRNATVTLWKNEIEKIVKNHEFN